MIEKISDLLLFGLDLTGVFGCYGMCSIFYPRVNTPAPRALFVTFLCIGIGFVFVTFAEALHILGIQDLSETVWPSSLGRIIFKSLLVGGLWFGNLWLRKLD